MPDERRLTLSVKEAAVLLGISKNAAYGLAQRGEFPTPLVRAGKRILVPRVYLERMLGELKTEDVK